MNQFLDIFRLASIPEFGFGMAEQPDFASAGRLSLRSDLSEWGLGSTESEVGLVMTFPANLQHEARGQEVMEQPESVTLSTPT